MRYQKLVKDGGVVWNVLDGTKIDPLTFTFKDHFGVVIKLLEKVDAAGPTLAAIRDLG
jgi:hypothetical protein